LNWQLILAYISPITSAALVVVGVVYGQLIANAKNAQIEQLREQLKTHELFEVRGVRERIEAIHAEYGERIDDLKRQLEAGRVRDEQRIAVLERQADSAGRGCWASRSEGPCRSGRGDFGSAYPGGGGGRHCKCGGGAPEPLTGPPNGAVAKSRWSTGTEARSGSLHLAVRPMPWQPAAHVEADCQGGVGQGATALSCHTGRRSALRVS
jgi:hypothetical protein